MRNCLLFIVLASFCAGQTRIDLRSQTRVPDFSSMPGTRPAQVGAALPATCSAGELYFVMTAQPGQNLFGCTATNVWSSLGALSGGCSIDSSGKLSCPGGLITGDGTQAGELRLFEQSSNGSSYISWLAPDNLANSYALRLPVAQPVSGQTLVFSGPAASVASGSWATLPGKVTDSVFFPAGAPGGSPTIGFDTNSSHTVTVQTLLPDNWDRGTVSAKLVWSAPSPASGQTMSFDVSSACANDGDSMTSPAFQANPRVTVPGAYAANARFAVRIGQVATTGCTPGSTLFVQVSANNVDTTMRGAAFWGTEIAFIRILE